MALSATMFMHAALCLWQGGILKTAAGPPGSAPPKLGGSKVEALMQPRAGSASAGKAMASRPVPGKAMPRARAALFF